MSLRENKRELVTSCWRLHPQLGQVNAFLLHLGSAKCQKSKGGLRVPQKNQPGASRLVQLCSVNIAALAKFQVDQ